MTGKTRQTRKSLIAARWNKIAIVSLLTCAITFPLARAYSATLEAVAKIPSIAPFIAAPAALALILTYRPWRISTFIRLRHVCTHPPLWIGLMLGLSLALWTIGNVDSVATDFGIAKNQDAVIVASCIVGGIPLLLVGLSCAMLPFGRKRKILTPGKHEQGSTSSASNSAQPPSPAKEISSSQLEFTIEDYLKWISDDSAISEPAKDLFGHRGIARHIAKRIESSKAPAQALVGVLGSGKTTIALLVERYLARTPQIVFVRVSLWPYETARAAAEGILEAIVEAFSSKIGLSSIKGLPAEYGDSIAKAGGGVSAFLLALLKRAIKTPLDTVQKFDDVATIAGIRCVVWVEDLERFAAVDYAAHMNVTLPVVERDRLAPIRALIDALGSEETQSLTVVTAATELFQGFDMERIARHVERISRINRRRTRAIISFIRRQHLNESQLVDPAHHARSKFGWDDEDTPEQSPIPWLEDYLSTFASAVSELATTPRALKQGLRRALDTWNMLSGEVDFDDLLAMSIMSEACPPAFALVDRNINSLRGLTVHRAKDEPNPIKMFADELQTLKLEDRTAKAITIIVETVFGNDSRRRPQGLAHKNHTDYWQRYLSVPELSEIERDQTVLRALVAPQNEAIIKLLLDNRRSPAVHDFGHLIERDRLIPLIHDLIEGSIKSDRGTWGDFAPPGFAELSRILSDRANRIDSAGLENTLIGAIELAVSRDLPLAYYILTLFAPERSEFAEPLQPVARERLRTKARDCLIRTYTPSPEGLIEQLREAKLWLLLSLCWWRRNVRSNNLQDEVFSEWPAFAASLLVAMSKAPEVIAPQVVRLVIREHSRMHDTEFLFDEKLCQQLFGDPDQFVANVRAIADRLSDPCVEAVVSRHTLETPESDDAGIDDDDIAATDNRDETHASDVDDEDVADSNDMPAYVSPRPTNENIPGYWYKTLAEIPPGHPGWSPSSAVVPEKPPLEGEDNCLCIHDQIPISETALFELDYAEALGRYGGAYFVTADWSAVFKGEPSAPIPKALALRRFGDIADTARSDSLAVLKLSRVPFLDSRSAEAQMLAEQYSLFNDKQGQRAVEQVLGWLDEQLRANRYEVVDRFLGWAHVGKMAPEALVSILAITVPAKSSLRERAGFLARTEEHLIRTLDKERTSMLLENRR